MIRRRRLRFEANTRGTSRRARLAQVAILGPLLVALETLPFPRSEPAAREPEAPPVVSRTPTPPTCPAGTLPDQGVCIPVPPAEALVATSTSHLDLMPGRFADYGRYLTPLTAYPPVAADGGPGVSIPAPARTVVTLIALERQVGSARRLSVPGPEPRLLTLHRVERHGVTRTYILSYEGLSFDTSAADAELPVGTPLGRLSPGAGQARSALHLTVRQVRRGIQAEQLPPQRLLSDAVSLSCDPRNVLPMKPTLANEGR